MNEVIIKKLKELFVSYNIHVSKLYYKVLCPLLASECYF
jgi:hypothetical protein